MDTKKCSVILPYYLNREPLLHTLRSLQQQTLPADEFEIILVDDGSSDIHLLDELRAQGLAENLFYFTYAENKGSGFARNYGTQQAVGEIVIYVDSDQILQPDFLVQHIAFFQQIPADQSVLQIGLRNEINPEPTAIADPAAHVVYADPRFAVFEFLSENLQRLEGSWHLGFSHNFSIRRRDLQSFGGFNPDAFYKWGLEDCEFSYRLKKQGVKLAYNPNILSYHLAHPVSWNNDEGYKRWNKNLETFCELHPEPEVSLQAIFRDFFDIEKREQRIAGGDRRPWLNCYLRFENAIRAITSDPVFLAHETMYLKDISLGRLKEMLVEYPQRTFVVYVARSRLDLITHVQLDAAGKRVMLFSY